MINIDVVNPLWPRDISMDTDELIENQSAPGPAPRPGLQWKPQTRRWIRPKDDKWVRPNTTMFTGTGVRTSYEELKNKPHLRPDSKEGWRTERRNWVWLAPQSGMTGSPAVNPWTFTRFESRMWDSGESDPDKDYGSLHEVSVDEDANILIPDKHDLDFLRPVFEKIADDIESKKISGVEDSDQDYPEILSHPDWSLERAKQGEFNVLEHPEILRAIREEGYEGIEFTKGSKGAKFYAVLPDVLTGSVSIENQAAPGPPPREGLRWKPQTRRWIRPKIDTQELESPVSEEVRKPSYVRESEKNVEYFNSGAQFWEKLKGDRDSPEYRQFAEAYEWLKGYSGPSGKSAVRLRLAEGDPMRSSDVSTNWVPNDYTNSICAALVGARYPRNNKVDIPKRHLRKIIDITLSSEEGFEGGDSLAGRMTKPYPKYKYRGGDRWGSRKEITPVGSKMELFDVERQTNKASYAFAQTVVHEMSHGVYFDLPFWYRIRIEHLYIKAVQENKGLPSQYSKGNDHEFFSECYTAYVTETDEFRERNPSMANELDMLFNKTLKSRLPANPVPPFEYPYYDDQKINNLSREETDRRRLVWEKYDDQDRIRKFLTDPDKGADRDLYLKEFEEESEESPVFFDKEEVSKRYGLTLEEYEMHMWNRENWPSDWDKGITVKEERLVLMEKTFIRGDQLVIEDPQGVIGFTEDLSNADPVELPEVPEDSFEEDIEELELQAPPGAPPRQGLVWKPTTHRWIRPEEFNVPSQRAHQLEETQRNQIQRSLDGSQDADRDILRSVNRESMDVAMEFGFVEGQSPIKEDVERIKEKTTRAIQTVINNPKTAVWTRVPEASLRKILAEGMFRTSHETGKTAPGKPAAKGDKLQRYLDTRKRIEISTFGESANPIYAYLSDHDEGKLRERRVSKSKTATSNPEDHYEDVGVMYGNMRVKLKPHIRQKTTVTNGDSYDNLSSVYLQFMSDIDYRMFPELFRHLAITQPMSEDFHKGYKRGMESHFKRSDEQSKALREGLDEFESRIENGDIKLKDLTFNYVEAQIHGGLSVDDIEEIVIDYKWHKSENRLDEDEDGNPKVSPQLLKILDDLGIPWRFGSKTSKENLYKMIVGE